MYLCVLNVNVDQFWQLEESQIHRGYYQEPGTKEAGSYNGQYYDVQLWKFEHAGGMYA